MNLSKKKVVSLLNCRKSPMSADIARSRKTKMNDPPHGKPRPCRGAFLSDPKGASPTQHVKEFENESLKLYRSVTLKFNETTVTAIVSNCWYYCMCEWLYQLQYDQICQYWINILKQEWLDTLVRTRALIAHTPRAPCICIIVQLGHNIAVDHLYLLIRGQCAWAESYA